MNPHNVTVKRGPVRFHSRTKTSGNYVKRMRRRGTYKIVCTIHVPAMRMRLEVGQPGARQAQARTRAQRHHLWG